LQDLIAEIKNL